MNVNEIKSYWIQRNDDGTFCLDIETKYYSVNYPRVLIGFVSNEMIAFPAQVKVVDEDNNVINNFIINIPNAASSPTSNIASQTDDTKPPEIRERKKTTK